MKFESVPAMFSHICKKYADSKNAFLVKKDGQYLGITYSEFKEKVECLSLGLLELGIRHQDRIGIASENRIEWLIASYAISSVGAVDVPIFPILTAKQEEYIFNDCSVSAIIVSSNFQLQKVMEFKDRLPSLRHVFAMNTDIKSSDMSVKTLDSVIDRGRSLKSPEERKEILDDIIMKISPNDLITLIYTSGTTGNPKGVMLSHGNILSNMTASIEALKFVYHDTFLSYLPWCHSFERTTISAAFMAGSTVAVAEGLDTIALNLKEIKPTIMTTVPRMLEMVRKKIVAGMDKESTIKKNIFNWSINIGRKYVHAIIDNHLPFKLMLENRLANKLVFSKIREKLGVEKLKFVSGGAALSPEVCEFFMAIGYSVIEGYGLTEASPVVSVTRTDVIEIGTIGRKLSNLEIKIAEDGEILVKGPSIMKGYWNDPVATNEAIDEEGWLYTGDVGLITEKGNIKITDRKKYIFVSSGGKNIAPQPIESLLAQSQYIEQCILIGDSREYCTALIIPDFEQLKKLADNFGLEYSSPSELIANPKIVKTVQQDIDRLQKDLSKFERVRKFSMLSQQFSIENGELTPKLSVKRHVVEKKFSSLIEQMYNID